MKQRVVFVDDEQNVLNGFRRMLERQSDVWDMVFVDSADKVLDKAKKLEVDVIVSDIRMPGTDGFELLKQLKAGERTKDIPVIIVTGNHEEDLKRRALDMEATDLLSKPVNTEELISRVQSALRLKSHQDALKNQNEILEQRVTERTAETARAYQAVRRAEEQYRTIFEHAVIGICRISPTGQFSIVNPALAGVLGYESSEELVRSVTNLIEIYVRPEACTELLDQLEKHGTVHNFTAELYRKDRTTIWASVGATAVRDSDGKLMFTEALVEDITQRTLAEQKIREQASLLDKTQDAIIVLDIHGEILFWNNGAQSLYGWTISEVVGKNDVDLLYKKEDRRAYDEVLAKTLATGEWTGELHQVAKDNKEVLVQSSWTRVFDAEGKPKSILIINADITEKRKLELQLLRAQRMESIGTLAGGVAHDLNNVLTPILMALQLLRDRATDDSSQRTLKSLEACANRGKNIVRQVLTFARGTHVDRTILQTRQLIAEIEEIVQETFPKSIQVVTNAPKDLWTVSADATQLYQVLLNLCVNARDAMPSGGILTVSAGNIVLDDHYARLNIEATAGAHVMVSVSDTGEGIPKRIIDRIFDPFFTTKEVGKGTGLGLSTALAIVKSHNGFMQVYSEENKGTEVKVYLPAAAVAELSQNENSTDKIPRGNGELILVVDDEVAIAQITRQTLEVYGYQVLVAADGAEAAELYARHREVAVVLTDMAMAVMDGPATIRVLTRMNPAVRIIGTSGLSSNREMIERSANAPLAAFLTKPYTAARLLTTIYEVLHSNVEMNAQQSKVV